MKREWWLENRRSGGGKSISVWVGVITDTHIDITPVLKEDIAYLKEQAMIMPRHMFPRLRFGMPNPDRHEPLFNVALAT